MELFFSVELVLLLLLVLLLSVLFSLGLVPVVVQCSFGSCQ